MTSPFKFQIAECLIIGRPIPVGPGHDVYAPAAFVERHFAIHEGKERPVPSRADIVSGHELGAALPHDDAAGGDKLAAKHFNA